MDFQAVRDSFVAIFRKEVLHMRRDRGTMLIALSIPVFQLILFGFIDQTVRDVPTVIVDQDHSEWSRAFVAKLEATGTFLVVARTDDPRVGRAEITRGRARVGVLLPPDFGRRRSRGLRTEPAQVLVLIDGSDSVVSAQALASVNGLAAADQLDARAEQVVPGGVLDVHPVVLFNPAGRTANYIIPGLVAILLQIVALVLAAVAIVRERERGTFEQLMVTPVNPLGLILGKLLPYLFLGMAEMVLILVAMRFGFRVPIRGSLLFLFVMAVFYLFALLSLGLFISTRSRTQAQAQQLAQLFFLPSIFLSGYIFPISGLPWPLYAVGRLLPATHMVEIMRGVVLRGAGPWELLPNVLSLLVICAVLVWLSVRRFRKVVG